MTNEGVEHDSEWKNLNRKGMFVKWTYLMYSFCEGKFWVLKNEYTSKNNGGTFKRIRSIWNSFFWKKDYRS